jgi:hypothetical protein
METAPQYGISAYKVSYSWLVSKSILKKGQDVIDGEVLLC